MTSFFCCFLFAYDANGQEKSQNVYGEPLQLCGTAPLTGFYRDGYCKTGHADRGTHVVCAEVSDRFLQFSKSKGNDLITARGQGFPGLKQGDKWCLCAMRWKEAYEQDRAPLVDLEATNQAALNYMNLQ